MTARHPLLPHRLRHWVTRETTGGALLLAAAAVALVWANSPWHNGYAALSAVEVGPAALHLDLPLATWASDGLLAVFFFVVGVELKQEIVAGSLRNIRESAVPVLAAIGGMVAPAVVFAVLVSVLGERSALGGWAIPTATDIAFALAVLAVFGRGLPSALRTFLLTLAVVDDLLAIIVIAVFFTHGIGVLPLAAAVVCLLGFAWLVRARTPRWWLLVPLALGAWGFLHASGVHATIAGVALGFCVPALACHGEPLPRTDVLGRALNPLSAGFALPVFAFFAAGVSLREGAGPLEVVTQPVFLAVAGALVLGKLVGVLGTAALVTRWGPLQLPGGLRLRALLPIGLLAGIGFTVSLLIAGLSFPDGAHTTAAKAAILAGSLVSATLGAAVLRWDARRAARGTEARGTEAR
ncbi:MAG: Na+/H+ antiporter NhaA [Cellulomonadaceae bacterium]